MSPWQDRDQERVQHKLMWKEEASSNLSGEVWQVTHSFPSWHFDEQLTSFSLQVHLSVAHLVLQWKMAVLKLILWMKQFGGLPK